MHCNLPVFATICQRRTPNGSRPEVSWGCRWGNKSWMLWMAVIINCWVVPRPWQVKSAGIPVFQFPSLHEAKGFVQVRAFSFCFNGALFEKSHYPDDWSELFTQKSLDPTRPPSFSCSVGPGRAGAVSQVPMASPVQCCLYQVVLVSPKRECHCPSKERNQFSDHHWWSRWVSTAMEAKWVKPPYVCCGCQAEAAKRGRGNDVFVLSSLSSFWWHATKPQSPKQYKDPNCNSVLQTVGWCAAMSSDAV